VELLEGLLAANLVLTSLVLVLLLVPKIRHLPGPAEALVERLATTLPVPPEALPEGHWWPQKADEFDGVMERWCCRDPKCGQTFLRRRV
jgi:hypothetical protein